MPGRPVRPDASASGRRDSASSEEPRIVAPHAHPVAVRIEDCPNCNHRAARHRTLDATVDSQCDGEDGTAPCACPLDRTAVGLAMAFAAALVKFG